MSIALLFIIPIVLSIASPYGFRLLGRNWSKLISLLILIMIGLVTSLLDSASNGNPQVLHFEWIPQLGINVTLRADSFGLFMALIITVIGAGIFSYTSDYMGNNIRTGTITAWLLLFMASMLGVVLADNIVLFFVCWELTSISSYILIGSNHHDPKARAGAKTALLITAVGGLALLAAVVLLGFATGVWNLSELPPVHDHPWAMSIFILICLAAFSKSAQWPFCFWLPSAMAAPTPISAYLHSATMVKAGIILLARMHPILSGHEAWTPTLVIVSAASMIVVIFAIPKATDLKALLAHSTVGALALMVCLIGIGTPYALNAMVVFLLAHACYKAPLFLIAGSIDHAVHSRDINALGGLAGKMPYTTIAGCLAGISMIGLPPMLGFAAKEMILEAGLSYAPWLITLMTLLITAFVMVVCCVVLIPAFGKNQRLAAKACDPSWSMLAPMLLLSLVGLASGLGLSPIEKYLIAPAVIALGVKSAELALWHGFTIHLALSAVAVLAGFLAYTQRYVLYKKVPSLPSGLLIHDAIWNAILGFARSLTRLIQNGSLTSYLGTTIMVTCALIFYAWVQVDAPIKPSLVQKITLAELSAGLLIMVSSLATAFARQRLPAIAALGSMGMGMTMFFIVSQAPDLALTQFLVEILAVVLLVVTFRHLPDFAGQPVKTQTGRLIISVVTGLTMMVLTLVALSTDYGQRISHWHGLNALTHGHGSNVVNVILVDFRALDTLGEITVLSIAALGVGVLMGSLNQTKLKKQTQ
jgi:multicomponent Na+:H+ antiporter subunit A